MSGAAGLIDEDRSPQASSWWPPGTYRRFPDGLPEWTPFKTVRRTQPDDATRRARAHAARLAADRLDEIAAYEEECTAFLNSRYCVWIHDVPSGADCLPLWHMRIQRRDGERAGPERYSDFMRIRDELFGPENEALEVYPARSREVDVANIYHLWVAQSPEDHFTVGFR